MPDLITAHHWSASGPPRTAHAEELTWGSSVLPAPRPGEITIRVVAAGVNPADLKHARAATTFPHPLGYEVSGSIAAIGPDTALASGSVSLDDEVVAFRVFGGYADYVTTRGDAVFAKPASLGFDEAAGLLLASSTAANLLHAARVQPGELIALHGASGAVGVAVLQLARLRGVRVIGTAAAASLKRVSDFGGLGTTYGPGVAARIAELADGEPIAATIDAVGTDEAVDAGLAHTADRTRIVTVAAPARAAADGFVALGGRQPASARYRDSVRAELISLAAAGELRVPIAATFDLRAARDALDLVARGHAGGKVVLHP